MVNVENTGFDYNTEVVLLFHPMTFWTSPRGAGVKVIIWIVGGGQLLGRGQFSFTGPAARRSGLGQYRVE